MGVLNVTPDSFSGDGLHRAPEDAALLAMRMVDEGADIIDIGGESTRPGHTPVSAEEELRRVLPAVTAVRAAVDRPISVDTRKAVVARQAVNAGASIINDVSGLGDRHMAPTAAEIGARLIIVHSGSANPGEDLLQVVMADLSERVDYAMRAGVPEADIVIDPGLGMGKGQRENFEIMRRLPELRALGFPILIGPSRKGMIGAVLGVPVNQRTEGTAALVVMGVVGGADMVRVHDVQQMVRVVRMTDAIVRSDARV